MKLTFTIYGEPTAKGRPRATVRGRHATVYTDAKTRTAENSVLSHALPHRPVEPLFGPLAITIRAYCSVPASWTARRRREALAGRCWPVKRPDVDNLAKLVTDPLNGIFYFDDSQIVSLTVSKAFAAVPQTVVEIATVEAEGSLTL